MQKDKKKNKKIYENYEKFLSNINLRKYENKYRQIKTVEQDLPRKLNPLYQIYEDYWNPDSSEHSFPSFENFFETWWKKNLNEIDLFIRKYFWGCSLQFVQLGLEARLYRTLISVLTQFQFCYLWNVYSDLSLECSADLDIKGIDALITFETKKIGLQIKKETYRYEAQGESRFSFRDISVDLFIEIPYTLSSKNLLKEKIENARKRAEIYKIWLKVSDYLHHFENGFVVFKPDYIKKLDLFIKNYNFNLLNKKISWEFLVNQIFNV